MNDLLDLVARAAIWRGVGHLMSDYPALALALPAVGVLWYLLRPRGRGRRRRT